MLLRKWSSNLRPLVFPLLGNRPISSFPTSRLLNSSLHCHGSKSIFSFISSPTSRAFLQLQDLGFRSPVSSFLMIQRRDFSSKERKRTKVTPVTSKLKKTKMKSYSSYKSRFRTMNDGNIRRWREGKRHNAHLKSKKAKRRLRLPSIVPAAYAKVMKKLNFCG